MNYSKHLLLIVFFIWACFVFHGPLFQIYVSLFWTFEQKLDCLIPSILNHCQNFPISKTVQILSFEQWMRTVCLQMPYVSSDGLFEQFVDKNQDLIEQVIDPDDDLEQNFEKISSLNIDFFFTLHPFWNQISETKYRSVYDRCSDLVFYHPKENEMTIFIQKFKQFLHDHIENSRFYSGPDFMFSTEENNRFTYIRICFTNQ